jgi:hypothetical protein
MAEKWVSPNQQRRLARIPEDKRDDLRAGIGSLAEFTAGMTPGLGDALTAKEAYDAAREGNYGTSALLAILAAIGLVPGAGDAASAAGKTALKTNPLTFYHGSPNNALRREDIKVFSDHSRKQNKRGRDYGGFYTSAEDRIADAQRYAGPSGTVYKVDLTPDSVIEDITGKRDITRLPKEYIDELRARGVSVVTGKDVLGRQEHAIIDEAAIANFAPYTSTAPNTVTNKAAGGPIEVNDRDPAKRRRLI